MAATLPKLKNKTARANGLNVAVVGCGLIGTRRAGVAQRSGACVKIVADVEKSCAAKLAAAVGSLAEESWESAVSSPGIDAVVVAAVNRDLARISLEALKAGKHVLCEKPAAINSRELAAVVEEARRSKRCFSVGYNHRYHPGIWKGKEFFEKGMIGKGISIRCRYGHGGRLGYEKEWRADAGLAGGGVLLDQGVHLVDLCRWFFGNFAEAIGKTSTDFWPVAPMEDNAWAILRTRSGQTAMFQNSWTQWKNLFSFELFGTNGFLTVEGLGGSYGVEQLKVYRRKKEFGVPELLLEEQYPGEDRSWELEWKEFVTAIEQERDPLVSGSDGLATLRTIEAIYESSKKGRIVEL